MTDSPSEPSHKHNPEISNTSTAQGLAYIGFGLFLTGPTAFFLQEFGTIGQGFDPAAVTQYMMLGILLIIAGGFMAILTGPTMYTLLDAADEKTRNALARLKSA